MASTWGPVSTTENAIWGAFKAAFVARSGQLLGLDKWLSTAGGAATAGSTTENFTVQVQTTTYTANISDWHGTVNFSRWGSIRSIDFHGLSNTRRAVLEVTRTYRVSAGSRVIYVSSPETVGFSKVSDYLNTSNPYPLYDVQY